MSAHCRESICVHTCSFTIVDVFLELVCSNTHGYQRRRQTPHCPCRALCELFRQKNKYCQRRRGEESESVWSQGAAEWSWETDKSSCFRNLNAALLRSSNMCLCVAAITQFQVLALCVHINLCNPTHLTDDVRLALSGTLALCLYVCEHVCVLVVVSKMSGIVFLSSKRNVNSGR